MSMTDTLDLTLIHRGVPLGVASVLPSNVFATGNGTATERSDVELVFVAFEPASGYGPLRPVFAEAWRAMSNFGFT